MAKQAAATTAPGVNSEGSPVILPSPEAIARAKEPLVAEEPTPPSAEVADPSGDPSPEPASPPVDGGDAGASQRRRTPDGRFAPKAESGEDTGDDDDQVDGDEDDGLEGDGDEEGTEGDEGEEEPASSWVDDSVRQLAFVYGMEDEDLQSIASRDEFNRVVRLMQRNLSAMGNQTPEVDGGQQPGQGRQQPGEQTSPNDKAMLEPDPENPHLLKNGLFNVAHYRDELGYDAAALSLIEASNRLTEHQRQQAETTKQQQEIYAEQQRQAYFNTFHEAIDAAGLDDVFGRATDDKGNYLRIPQQQLEAREKVFKFYQLLANDPSLSGASGPTIRGTKQADLVKRAILAAFPEAASAKRRSQLNASAANQSKRVRPVIGGHNASLAHRVEHANDVDPFDAAAIASNPKVKAVWNRLQEEQGLD